MTEDIDSEWPSEPEASAEPFGSLAPATDDVDSGWLNDGEPEHKPASKLTQPNFPSDPALPNELWGAVGAESRRGGKESSPPLATPHASEQPRSEPGPAESAASAPIATAPAVTTDVFAPRSEPVPRAAAPRESKPAVSPAAPASRGKVMVGLLVAAALAGLWFVRGGSRPSEQPGVQALRPEATHVESAKVEPAQAEPAKLEPAQGEAAQVGAATGPAAIEPAPSAASRGGVEPAAATQPGAPAPSASAESSPGKIVVIVNVRPPQARIFYRGKEAGKSPLRVELEPGQRRSFEVGYPGFMTRKIVVDGSKPELLVGLRAASPYATGSSAPEN
ncbi:MAG TPA: hypothetical protein VG937_05570 [Polyangiaceae bacterium]|nr:hypothetical protein [Polyangiaceae bacterium]